VAGGLVLGVDGGNTKTVALVATADGTVVGAGRGGQSDIYNAPSPGKAVTEITGAAGAALMTAGARPSDLDAAVFSLAGADWPEDFELLSKRLGRWLGAGVRPTIVNDSIGAIRCGTPDGVGVAAVCGTWTAVGARRADGAVFHLGFWPDEAGGVPLGDEGLRAVYRADIGTGPPTALTERALAVYGVPTPLELLHQFTRRGGLPRGDVARFASAVLDEADTGDPIAAAIVGRQAGVLARQANAAARQVGLEAPYPVVLAGGVFRHPSDLLRRLMAEQVDGGVIVRAMVEPAAGALLLALDAGGADGDLVDRVRETLPGDELFATAW
jgi:N-acetylglucosamine kinase-like BadF-type ATPase